jgi:hypothetical protein
MLFPNPSGFSPFLPLSQFLCFSCHEGVWTTNWRKQEAPGHQKTDHHNINTVHFFLKRSAIFQTWRNNYSRWFFQRLPRPQDEGTPSNNTRRTHILVTANVCPTCNNGHIFSPCFLFFCCPVQPVQQKKTEPLGGIFRSAAKCNTVKSLIQISTQYIASI